MITSTAESKRHIESIYMKELGGLFREQGMTYILEHSFVILNNLGGGLSVQLLAKVKSGESLCQIVTIPEIYHHQHSMNSILDSITKAVRKAVTGIHDEAVRIGIFAAVEQVNEAECERMMHL